VILDSQGRSGHKAALTDPGGNRMALRAAKKEQKRADGWLAETLKTVVYALLLAAAIRTLFFQPFWIPSGSMKPTLLIGDFLFVNKFAYGYSRHSCPFSLCPFPGRIWAGEPERGDVIVFKHPIDGSDYIKRLVGLPGDRIMVRDGLLHINGTPVEVTPDGEFAEVFERQGPMQSTPNCANGVVGLGGTCLNERNRETLPGGVTHAILNTTVTSGDNTEEFVVPEGKYFMMGDNRDNSSDSRFRAIAGGGVGFVPFENFVGRADRIMFSSGGRSMFFFWTWRPDRFFKAVD
jgi:signal peptidase I